MNNAAATEKPSVCRLFFDKLKSLFAPENLPGVFGAAFAFLMMLFHPLIYDNYFFNINRYKYSVMCYASAAGFIAYVLLTVNRIRKADKTVSFSVYLADAAMLVFLLVTVIFCFTSSDVKTALMFAALSGFCIYMLFSLYRTGAAARQRSVRLTVSDIGMLLFVLIAFVSCMMSDNIQAAFSGTNGRRNGLLCLIVIGGMHVIVSRAPNARKAVIWALVISGAVCAYIGVINFFKIDPLGFYNKSLKADDHPRFISTIGNIDFFCAFLCLSLPAVTTLFVSGKGYTRYICLPCIAVGAAALIAARADGAMIGFAGSVFFALYAGLKNRKSMISCLSALSAMFLGFAVTGFCMRENPDGYFSVQGSVMSVFAEHSVLTGIIGILLAVGAVCTFLYLRFRQCAGDDEAKKVLMVFVCLLGAGIPFAFLISSMKEERKNEIFRKIVLFSLCAVIVTAAACMFVHYTFIDTETELTGIKNFFRFCDDWGTYRGGVWTRCLKLYAQSDLRVKLIGFGPDELKKPLADAYGKEIAAYSGYSFDNAHNELIQYLLTLGALGLSAYLLFVAGSMYTLFRKMKNCPYALAAFAAGATYFLHTIVTVNQPITTPLFFLLLSAGVSCARKKEEPENAGQISLEGEKHETAETGKTDADETPSEG